MVLGSWSLLPPSRSIATCFLSYFYGFLWLFWCKRHSTVWDTLFMLRHLTGNLKPKCLNIVCTAIEHIDIYIYCFHFAYLIIQQEGRSFSDNILIFIYLFENGLHCVTLASLELTTYTPDWSWIHRDQIVSARIKSHRKGSRTICKLWMGWQSLREARAVSSVENQM